MNVLHERLLRGGDLALPLRRRPNTSHFRQYLPTSAFTKYDMVVSSRSLMELDSMELRIRTLDILWKTVNLNGYLVIVEAGNVRGSELILEARKYLMEAVNATSHNSQPEVIAPCPHSLVCPLMKKKPKHRLCADAIQYYQYGSKTVNQEPFSYLIVHKRMKDHDTTVGTKENWPRIVQPILRPTGFDIIRVCHKKGELQELNVSKGKHGRLCKAISRRAKLGDLFPVEIVPPAAGAKVVTFKQKQKELRSKYKDGNSSGSVLSSDE